MAQKPDKMTAVTLRFKESARAKLAAAAEANATSLNSEIVARLNRSLDRDGDFGGQQTATALQSLLIAIQTAESQTGKGWREDIPTFFAAFELMQDTLDQLRPLPNNNDAIQIAFQELQIATDQAKSLLSYLVEVGAVEPMSPIKEMAPKRRGLFGGAAGTALMPIDDPHLKATLGAMEAAGVINGDGSEDELRIIWGLRHKGHQMCFSLRTPIEAWQLNNSEGQPMTEKGRAGVWSALSLFAAMAEKERSKSKEFLCAFKEDDAQVAEGKAIADSIRAAVKASALKGGDQ